MNILNYLTENELKYVKTVEFKKGDILFYEEDKCNEVGIIAYGELEIATTLPTGEKVVYNRMKKDDVWGSNLLFSSKPFYKGDVSALAEGKAYLIMENDLKRFLKENDVFLTNYLKAQGEFAMKLNYRIKLLSIPGAKERIMFALENTQSGQMHIKSVTIFSELLGLTREATSRAITKLVDEGFIDYNDKVITIKK